MYYRSIAYKQDVDKEYDYLTWLGYGLFVLVGIIFFLICCCFNAIKIGIAVFKTTS